MWWWRIWGCCCCDKEQNTQNVFNEPSNLVQEISRQNIQRATWLPLGACDRTGEEAGDLKNSVSV